MLTLMESHLETLRHVYSLTKDAGTQPCVPFDTRHLLNAESIPTQLAGANCDVAVECHFYYASCMHVQFDVPLDSSCPLWATQCFWKHAFKTSQLRIPCSAKGGVKWAFSGLILAFMCAASILYRCVFFRTGVLPNHS